ncbi:MAG: AAA family ATPase [Rhizobacter sp.]|nr:AAA family ATPase [Rhizobacter sp.]
MHGTGELLERDELLAALSVAAEAAARGQGATVLVSGEAGIGKTSLIERFAATLGHGRVLWGACEALATPRPLGPLHDIAGDVGPALRAALARPGDRAALFAAVLDELARLPTPAVVVFEDVHWADDATLDLVKYLGRRIRHAGALLVLSHRDDPASLDKLRDVQRSGTLQRIGPVCAARAEAAWMAGDDERAAREAARAADLAAAKRHPWLLGELAFWRHRAGDLIVAPRGCAEPFALQTGGRWSEAAAAWRAMGCPYEEARALADGDEAAQRAALALLDKLGAKPLAERVRRRMRQAGVRSVPRGAAATTRSNEAGLTARELEVLALVADGRRNVEIAKCLSRSARTIEHHVESILAKLEVGSRAEAVTAARRLGLLAQNG